MTMKYLLQLVEMVIFIGFTTVGLVSTCLTTKLMIG